MSVKVAFRGTWRVCGAWSPQLHRYRDPRFKELVFFLLLLFRRYGVPRDIVIMLISSVAQQANNGQNAPIVFTIDPDTFCFTRDWRYWPQGIAREERVAPAVKERHFVVRNGVIEKIEGWTIVKQ